MKLLLNKNVNKQRIILFNLHTKTALPLYDGVVECMPYEENIIGQWRNEYVNRQESISHNGYWSSNS